MNRDYAGYHYSTLQISDNKEGFAGLELYRSRDARKDRIAAVIFWDATGQFSVETFKSDVPLDIMEELITETKRTIKIR